MLHRLTDPRVQTLLGVLSAMPNGATLAEIQARLTPPTPRRTVQYWLRSLNEEGRVRISGAARSTRYFARNYVAAPTIPAHAPAQQPTPVTATSLPASASTTPSAPPNNPGPESTAVTASSTAKSRPVSQPSTAPVTVPPAPGRTTKPKRDPRYEELMQRVIPRAIRSSMTPQTAESFLRGEANLHLDGPDAYRKAFIADAIAELDALTETTAAKYGISASEFFYWRKAVDAQKPLKP